MTRPATDPAIATAINRVTHRLTEMLNAELAAGTATDVLAASLFGGIEELAGLDRTGARIWSPALRALAYRLEHATPSPRAGEGRGEGATPTTADDDGDTRL